MRTLVTLSLAVATLLALASHPAIGQDKKDLQKAMAERYPAISALKADGKIGETWKGYICGVKSTKLDEQVEVAGKKMTLEKLIYVENADRLALYTLIAKERSTDDAPVTAEYVGERSAKDQFKNRLKPGEYFLRKNGKWVQKPRPR